MRQTLLVGEELPAISNIQVGFPTTIDVSAVTDYDNRRFDNWFTNFMFNDSSMVVGQRIAMGGTIDTSTGNFVPGRIVLRRQGVEGDLVQGSVDIVSGNQGSFQVQNNRMMGYLLGGPLTVQTGNLTLFFNINGLSDLQSGGSLTVAGGGLMLKDPASGIRSCGHTGWWCCLSAIEVETNCGRPDSAAFLMCAEQVRQLEGESPFDNQMEVKS